MTREDVIHYLRSAPWKTARFGANVRFFRGDTLVRYIDVPFFEGMEDAVGWLCSDEGCAEVFVDGKRPKVRWKPLRAWYEDSGGPGGRSWRLYHAVRNAEDADADGPYAVENGCVYKEEHTFFWRVAEVMEAPEGGSGVAYSIQGIRRDGESGLFSYVLVRRERVQVDVGPWLSHQETGETRESALLLGVREEEGSGVDDKIADFAQRHGMRVDDGDGTVVDIQKSKNDDCTTDVTLVNTSEEPVDAAAESRRETLYASESTEADRHVGRVADAPGLGEEIRQERTPGGKWNVTKTKVTPKTVESAVRQGSATIFSATESTTDRNRDEAGAPPASAAGDGTIRTFRSERTPEGKHDVTETVETELEVLGAAEARRKTAFAEEATKTDRNTGRAAGLPEVGEEIRQERTPGGKWNVTKSTVTPRTVAEGEAGVDCESTVYEHRHTETGRNLDGVPDGGEAQAPDAASGKTFGVSARMNELGKMDVERRETTERLVPNHRTSKSVTALEDVEVTSAANDPAPPDDPEAADEGTTVSVDRQVTPSGRTTWSKRLVTAKGYQQTHTFGKDGSGRTLRICVFQNQKALPAGDWTGGGFRKNAFGLFDGQFSSSERDSGGGGGGQDAWEQTYEVSDGDIFYVGKKVFRRTVTMTYVQGVLHDNDPSEGSSQSAAAKLAGCNRGDIAYLGDGWWSYKGYRNKRETHEQIGTVSDDGSNFFDTSW